MPTIINILSGITGSCPNYSNRFMSASHLIKTQLLFSIRGLLQTMSEHTYIELGFISLQGRNCLDAV